MSALTDLFTAMANKIRSKTGTATTYTPSEMVSDGIDDVFDAGVASATTPITPSNSSPASMTANTGYKPTTNGYAIASYDSVTPSSTPESVASGDIVKIGGSGVIVDAIPTPTSITPSNTASPTLVSGEAVVPTRMGYAVQSIEDLTPSNSNPVPIEYLYGNIYRGIGNGYAIESYNSITPSNSSPVDLSSGSIYKMGGAGKAVESITSVTPSNGSPVALASGDIDKMGGNGYAIASYSSITPSNSSPVSLSSGSFYKPSASGYAISSYSSKTPSDTSPASVSSGAIIKASSAGYLVKNTPVDLGVPDLVSQLDMAASASRNITVTSKPRVVILIQSQRGSDGAQFLNIYDSVKDKYTTATYISSSGYSYTSGTGLPGRITTVSATTVTVRNASTGYGVRSSVLIYY